MILTIARSIDWVTKVVVDSVALLALFTNNSLGCAMAPSSFVVTLFGLAITFACLTCASINRRSKEAFGTFFAMFTFSVILTRLVTFGGILGTRTMTIAHTIRTRCEMPRWSAKSLSRLHFKINFMIWRQRRKTWRLTKKFGLLQVYTL